MSQSAVSSLFCVVLYKGKAVPLQPWTGPQGSRKLMLPDFVTTAQDGGKVVSLMHQPPLPPGNTPGTHFCWRLSRPQGRSAIGRILCQWKVHWHQPGFVAQHLNHCATAVPTKRLIMITFTSSSLTIYFGNISIFEHIIKKYHALFES